MNVYGMTFKDFAKFGADQVIGGGPMVQVPDLSISVTGDGLSLVGGKTVAPLAPSDAVVPTWIPYAAGAAGLAILALILTKPRRGFGRFHRRARR